METTISRLSLSDSAPRLLLLLCIQSALDTSTSSLGTSVSELLEKWGDQRGRSGAAEIRRKKKEGEGNHKSKHVVRKISGGEKSSGLNIEPDK